MAQYYYRNNELLGRDATSFKKDFSMKDPLFFLKLVK